MRGPGLDTDAEVAVDIEEHEKYRDQLNARTVGAAGGLVALVVGFSVATEGWWQGLRDAILPASGLVAFLLLLRWFALWLYAVDEPRWP